MRLAIHVHIFATAHASAYNYERWTYALIEFMAWMVDGWFCDPIASILGNFRMADTKWILSFKHLNEFRFDTFIALFKNMHNGP